MNAGDRDFVENFVAQTKADKNLSVVCDARCVLMKMEGTMLLTTTAPEFSETQRSYKQGYRLIGGFVLSGKTMGDRVMDWVCPAVRVEVHFANAHANVCGKFALKAGERKGCLFMHFRAGWRPRGTTI
jgi:hypothetical protein